MGPEPDYTAAETAAMITQYPNTNAAQFADEKINLLNIGDPQYESYYRNNAALDTSFGSMMGGTFAGIGQGTANAAEKTVDSAWALFSNPAGTAEHVANGLVGITRNPADTVMGAYEARETRLALQTLYGMQGNYAGAAALQTQSDLEFALSLIPSNRAKVLAELNGGAKATGEASKSTSITTITDEMKANPYDPGWQIYTGNEPRAVGADVVSGGAKEAAGFPEGISFNPNIENHLSGFDGLTQKSGISGTHNLDAFSQAASSNGLKILRETPSSVEGIATIEYQIPAYDRAVNITGYKDRIFTKTVYDPKVFSDQKNP